MKYFLVLVISISNLTLYSQDFSTKFYFKDGEGRIDSVLIGYTENATDSLNKSLGEIMLLDSQIDTTFFVGISDVIFPVSTFQKATFRTKTKYVSSIPINNVRIIGLDFICHNYPMTIEWDSNIFNNIERSKSLITLASPGCWFDCGEYPHFLLYQNNIQYYYSNQNSDYSKNYVEGSGGITYIDSIHSKPIKILKLYVGFANDDYVLIDNLEELDQLNYHIYPTLCDKHLTISNRNNTLFLAEIYDISGKLVKYESFYAKDSYLDVSALMKGIYLLRIISNNAIENFKIYKL